MLCTSELVTNALLHGTPPIQLEVLVDARVIRVEVRDSDTQAVERRRPVASEAARGHGLEIVDALVAAWGSHTGAEGKVAWFEMALDTDGARSPRQ